MRRATSWVSSQDTTSRLSAMSEPMSASGALARVVMTAHGLGRGGGTSQRRRSSTPSAAMLRAVLGGGLFAVK